MSSNPDVPPFTGYVETTLHALRLIHAARQGVIPRITRRLNDSERRSMIKTGAVFVFSVEESGIKRWTDGLLWSPSRIVGNFLVYREINERTSSRGAHRKPYPMDSPSRGMPGRRNSPDHSLVAFRGPGHLSQSHSASSDPGAFKTNGLIKKTITVTIEGSDLHLISYYTSDDIRSGRLKRPTSRPDIMALTMPPHIFRLTNFRVPPKVEIGPDGKPRLVCEGEDLESTTLECKVEEPAYRVSESSHWTSDSEDAHSPRSIDGSFGAGSPLYPHHSTPSPTIYSREGTVDRWPSALENLRIIPVDRQDFADSWSSSPSPTHSHNAISRRKDIAQVPQNNSSSWSAGHSQPTRWRSDSYNSASGNGMQQLDRTRVRSNTVFENPTTAPHRRDSEPGVQFSRDGVPQRTSWTSREATYGDKYPRPQTSFTNAVSSPPFSQHHGYHRMAHSFGTSWPPSGHDSPVQNTLHAIQSLPTYEAPYLASSPEGFSVIDEYRDGDP
ncbi:Gti1/Pac2 family-domain-containing protein [Lyophyllum atratum]|nr:Gti1/Pac2 family-domain-containing protein [Lyophyllum atratum]